MDSAVSKALQDKLYDKRKAGALELENLIRNALADNNHDKIAKIVNQLCQDYAYAVHQPHARNGGLIGLAAAAIALGSEVARYLRAIVPPVLACFSHQDARVRYYACESMYNIAKVAKGEILVYFNDMFDALCKLSADTEPSVKNGSELLDRLIKDIVSESAATYASVLVADSEDGGGEEQAAQQQQLSLSGLPTAFSLPRFVPLLQERIHVLNPFTRTFLVSWITLLDSIPDLELVAYLPSFLAGLLKFLNDPNQDVHTTTTVALDRFLTEIKKIAAVKKGIAESKKDIGEVAGREASDAGAVERVEVEASSRGDDAELEPRIEPQDDAPHAHNDDDQTPTADTAPSVVSAEHDETDDEGEYEDDFEDEWIPGQDVQIDYERIIDIIVTFLSESSEEEVQVTALKWIEAFLDICPEVILLFTPRLLAQLLPALSHDVSHVKQAANRVNQALMAYIVTLPGDSAKMMEQDTMPAASQLPTSQATTRVINQANGEGRRESVLTVRSSRKLAISEPSDVDSQSLEPPNNAELPSSSPPIISSAETSQTDLDYEAAVNALTRQFFHEHEATRVAALAWLIMLHRRSPRRILAIQDATFPALLKTLSDPAEAVVTRDLLLLSQISKSSDDAYFTSFMINLLKLFSMDRRLLESRGNLIIRQLCVSLSPEKIYRTMADCLERDADDDVDFAAIMVQNLNNNLLTAPELAELRKRLRNLDGSRDSYTSSGPPFFTVLFRAWCVNAVATFSLCLLAQAYEQAYNLLQIFAAELEMTVGMLIQIDKLVQLLESPVFTYLRMQLLEPERFPFLYKCLYGLLMLLPQSSAFAALKNRLGSVSAIGYLHAPPSTTFPGPSGAGAVRSGAGGAPGSGVGVSATPSTVSTFERQNRLKGREAASAGGEGAGIRWTELLDKFKATQERVRRSQRKMQLGDWDDESEDTTVERSRSVREGRGGREGRALQGQLQNSGKGSLASSRPGSAQSFKRQGMVPGASQAGGGTGGQGHTRGKSSLSQLARFGAGRNGGGNGVGSGRK